MYETCARDLVVQLMRGFNGTLLAYGETGAGNTVKHIVHCYACTPCVAIYLKGAQHKNVMNYTLQYTLFQVHVHIHCIINVYTCILEKHKGNNTNTGCHMHEWD